MNKISYLFILCILFISGTSAQENQKAAIYSVPSAYNFDYSVTYEISREENKIPETVIYYFTKSGYIMGMKPSESQKDMDMDFMISTKDGLRITFGEEPIPTNPDRNRKVLKVMDMRSMIKGAGNGLAAVAKALPEKEKAATENKQADELDNFKKTGKTKQVFGYTAEEYSKEFTKDDKGVMHTGTMSVWYAMVDFDPQMMFSMGMGNLAGRQSQSKVEQSHPNNMMGIGITRENYLLTEMDFVEKGGKSGTAMKVISVEKTSYSRNTGEYYIKNYSGMSMKEMMLMNQLEK